MPRPRTVVQGRPGQRADALPAARHRRLPISTLRSTSSTPRSRPSKLGRSDDADAAQPARRRVAPGLGHAHRAHRDPAALRRTAAPTAPQQRRATASPRSSPGVGVTGLIQSSTATALIVAAFAGQGLIGTAPALAVMLGADVGTSLVTVVLSFDLSWLAPFLIFVGVVLFLARQAETIGRFGRILIGLGLIIFALQWIGVAARPVVEAAGVKVIFASLTGDLLLDMLVAALLTIVCYSSLAVVLLLAAFASLKVIALPVALGLVLGANLGSGLLGILSTLRVAAGGAAGHARQLSLQADRLRAADAGRRPCRGLDRGPEARSRAGGRAVPPRLQRRASRSCSSSSPRRSRASPSGCSRRGRRPRIPRSRATSTPPRSTRRRSPSPARRARRCGSATSSSRC